MQPMQPCNVSSASAINQTNDPALCNPSSQAPFYILQTQTLPPSAMRVTVPNLDLYTHPTSIPESHSISPPLPSPNPRLLRSLRTLHRSHRRTHRADRTHPSPIRILRRIPIHLPRTPYTPLPRRAPNHRLTLPHTSLPLTSHPATATSTPGELPDGGGG